MVPYLLKPRFLRSGLRERILFESIVSQVGVVYFGLIRKLRIEVEGIQPKFLVGNEAGIRNIWGGVEDCSIVYLLSWEIVHNVRYCS